MIDLASLPPALQDSITAGLWGIAVATVLGLAGFAISTRTHWRNWREGHRRRASLASLVLSVATFIAVMAGIAGVVGPIAGAVPR